MDAIRELFTTDIGLLSIFTIVFATGIVIYAYNFVKKHMEEDAKKTSM